MSQNRRRNRLGQNLLARRIEGDANFNVQWPEPDDFHWLRHQVRVLSSEPLFDSIHQVRGEGEYCFYVRMGDQPGGIVDTHAALLSISIQRVHTRGVKPDRVSEGLNDAEVVGVAFGDGVSAGGKRGGRCLESRVVGDVEFPIVAQSWSPTVLQVTVGQREKVGDFGDACLVNLQPAVLAPLVQAHCHLRSETPFRP